MRYLRLYLYFVRFSFSRALEFRLDFTFRIVMDVIYYVVNILFFKVIYLHTPLLAGWTEEQMMIFISSYLLIDALNMTIFSSNLWWLPIFINKGDLDYYLIRPVSPLFFLSLREFSANSFFNLVIAAGIFVFSLISYSGEITFWKLCLLGLLIGNGIFIYYLIHLLAILPVFWTHSSKGFNDLFYTMQLAMERPDRIYKGWLRVLFTAILPFSLVASFPARLFLEEFNWSIFAHLIVITIALWTSILFIWGKGLKAYASASS